VPLLDEDLAAGALFPHVSQARDIAAHVAASVAQKAYQANVATELPKPPNLLEMAYTFMFTSDYKSLK
jgi:malate dehydrogenase (oxaloacetate-decarboxylating)(NADP+)